MLMRIVVKDLGDRAEELRLASIIRRDLFAHSPVEIDPDNSVHGTHRDERGRAYFELATDLPAEVDRVFREFGHADSVEIEHSPGSPGEACQNCGNISGRVLPTVCPNCQFRDISSCPVCATEVPRRNYLREGGSLFCCPHCGNRVRLRYNDPMFLNDGSFNQPLVVVDAVEVPAR
ncbi:MAG: hypothetical protein WEA31_02200 [Pirellulales bacterium]